VIGWTVVLDTQAQVDELRSGVEAAGLAVEPNGGAFSVRDPWGIALHIQPR
jgi:hypothetical protein